MLKVSFFSLCWYLVSKHIKNLGVQFEKTMKELKSEPSSSNVQVSDCRFSVQCFTLCGSHQKNKTVHSVYSRYICVALLLFAEE